jgi:hypothetical protein
MSDTIVDSSVVAKWVLPEADLVQAQRLISEVARVRRIEMVCPNALRLVVSLLWQQNAAQAD